MDVSQREGCTYAFGSFRLNPQRRTLLHNGTPVPLTSRLFDALLYLVQNHDRLVERGELEQAIWPGRSVEDGNLQKAVAAVRKALETQEPGETFIVTAAGRGFRFTMPVVLEPNVAERIDMIAQAQGSSAEAGLFGRTDGAAPTAAAQPIQSWWTRAALSVGALALVIAGAAVWYFVNRPAPFSPPPHSVAVMAFANLSGDPCQEYFSDGLSEELINALGRVGAVRVAARQSAFSFKGKSATIADIARLLNVGTVLEGSVRRNRQQLRITVQLIDTATGFQLWSHSYDRDQGDILMVQGDIAEAVAASLQVQLLGTDVAQLTLGGTTNPKALDAYLRAITMRRANRPGANKPALAAFNEALALDPKFALAHTGLAILLTAMSNGINEDTVDLASSQKLAAHALTEAELAVSLAPKLGVAHEALADLALYQWQFARADTEYSLALALAPEDDEVNLRYALYQMDLGHISAGLAAAKRGAELNPLSPRAYLGLALTLVKARRPEEALDAVSHAEQLAGEGSAAPQRAEAEIEKGDMQAASRTCSAERDLLRYYCLAIADHALGKQNDAETQLAKLRAAAGDDAAAIYAKIYAQWGRLDDALAWLETAYRLRDTNLLQLKADPEWDPIRDTPRFKEIERQMNFPP
jgi:TolB-like protein/DNA-binding winged helix-turn-helix (wHTH) protein